MKNLPERDFWKDVGKRLGAYTEEPADDGWDKIARTLLPQRPPRGLIWTDRFAGLTLLVYLSFMAGYSVGTKEPAEGGKPMAGIEARAGEGTNDTEAVPQDQPSEEKQSAPAGQSVGNVLVTDQLKDNKQASVLPSDTTGNGDDMKTAVRSAREADHRTTSAGQALGNGHVAINSSNRSSAGRQLINSDQRQSSRTSTIQSGTGSNDEENNSRDHNTVSGEGERERGESVTGKHNRNEMLQADSDFSAKAGSSSSPEGIDLSEISDTQALKNNVPLVNNAPADSIIDPVMVAEVPKVDSAASSVTEAKAPAKKKKKNYPQLYFVLSPSLSFQKLTPLQTDQVNVKGMQSPGILSADRFGISFEAGFQRPIAKHFEVYTGISYYQQKQTLTYEYLSDDVEVSSSATGQYIVQPKTATKDFRYNMLNAGISAGMFYHLKGKKLMHKLGAGIQFQKGLLRAGSEETYDNAGSSYFNYQVLYRVEYLLNNKVNIFVQPGFTHAFYARELLDEPFTIKPYRASLGFGMLYHF